MSTPSLADADLAALVTEWLDWAEAGEQLGVTPAKVRTMIRDHELAAAVSAPGAGPRDALRENRGAEVKRRAQAMAF